VVFPNRVRWYYYRPADDVVIAASEPESELPGFEQNVAAVRRVMQSFESGIYQERSPLIPIPGTRVVPRPDAKFAAAAGLWPRSPEEWQRFCRALEDEGWSN
jgi:hypothetical protein